MPRERHHIRSVVAGRERVLVDSGVWIALVRANDQHHAAADQMLRQAIGAGTRLVTTNLIVAEVHRFILFHVGIKSAALVLDRMKASPRLAIEYATEAHHEAARKWIEMFSDQRITYTDAISFAVMEAARCSAVMSFDYDFVTAGFRLWAPASQSVAGR